MNGWTDCPVVGISWMPVRSWRTCHCPVAGKRLSGHRHRPVAQNAGTGEGRFPDVSFVNQMVGEIKYEAEFDGACSLSSLLYLDPIDLSHGIYRLHRALKPGGLLFLFANDLHPDWRGAPYGLQIDQWMWSWSYGIEEATWCWTIRLFQGVEGAECDHRRGYRGTDCAMEKVRPGKLRENDPIPASGDGDPAAVFFKIPSDLSYCYAILARREGV